MRNIVPLPLILLIICAWSCWTCRAAFSNDRSTLSEVVKDIRAGATVNIQIHPGLPTYVFNLIGNPELNIIDRIEISKQTDPTIIQSLDAGMGDPPYRGADYFQAEDINFDGYLDIKLLTWWGATGNRGYNYWLFDEPTGRFVYDQAFSKLCNAAPHSETTTITTSLVGGMAGGIHTFATFQVVDGTPVLVHEERQDWIENGKYFLKVTKRVKNGKLEVVSKEIVRDVFW